VEILRSSWVVPVTSAPLRDGCVAVDQGRVVWVGVPGGPGRPDAPERDLGAGVLMPGLVNAHCHLELSHLRGRLDVSQGFVPWVRALVEARGAARPETVREAIVLAVREVEASGTVALGDVSNALLHLDVLERSSLEAVVFYELIGLDPAKAAEVLSAARERLAALGGTSRTRVRVAAHAPYSVSPELLRLLAGEGGPAAIHVAESEAESRFLASGEGEWREFLAWRGLGDVPFPARGQSPVGHLAGLGVLHSRLVAAHCVRTDGEDHRALARAGVHVALCPRSNRALGVGMAPVPELLSAGVRLCLGTDSLASAPNLDLWEDALALHREFPAIEPAAIVHMATRGGAEALGLPGFGEIAPGARPGLVYTSAAGPGRDPYEALFSGEVRLRRVA
jgi:cytosine/adenosine deaminase-related metal-dependent hydrolase